MSRYQIPIKDVAAIAKQYSALVSAVETYEGNPLANREPCKTVATAHRVVETIEGFRTYVSRELERAFFEEGLDRLMDDARRLARSR